MRIEVRRGRKSSPFMRVLLGCFEIKIRMKSVLTNEKDAQLLASIARRVCWWQMADVTLENRPLFLCRVMVFGTWEDICFALDHHGKTAFREALQSAPPGLFDN